MEAQDALIFIPDISGFSKFVHNTEISHAAHITEELLNLIIDANELDLKVSEIEGDAVLFYRFGKAPTHREITEQAKKMFLKFHSNLKLYETQRICQCGACSGANKLQLKFIAHYGELTEKKIKEHSKLFGSDLIIAHRLLKNSIESDQYLLETSRIPGTSEQIQGIEENTSAEEYENGRIGFRFYILDPWLKEVPDPEIEDYSIDGANKKIMEFKTEINSSIETVFNVLTDLPFRSYWIEYLKKSEDLNGPIAKEGSHHRCVIKNDQSDPEFTSHNFKKSDGIISFAEANYKDKFVAVYMLKRISNDKTILEATTFVKASNLKVFAFKIFIKKKLEKRIRSNFNKLKYYCESLQRDGKSHGESIVF
ncbi:MAG: DUF2652 domain-containing protein [Bacteroidia bacterium]|nr:DUF2652 domain-containing protein [Bacteroidia bacterium]